MVYFKFQTCEHFFAQFNLQPAVDCFWDREGAAIEHHAEYAKRWHLPVIAWLVGERQAWEEWNLTRYFRPHEHGGSRQDGAGRCI